MALRERETSAVLKAAMASPGDRAVEGFAITLSTQSAKEKLERTMYDSGEENGTAVPRTTSVRLEGRAEDFIKDLGCPRWIECEMGGMIKITYG
jgi:hypothetical protein